MYTKLLVAIDGSHTSQRALDAAIQFAREHQAQLHVLHVIDNPLALSEIGFSDFAALRTALLEEGKRLLDNARSAIQAAGIPHTTEIAETEMIGDDIAHQIEEAAQRYGADLVILGTHGYRGMRRLFLGSVAERFLRLTTRPVLLIPKDEPHAT